MRELVSKVEAWLEGPEREPQRATERWAKRRSKFLKWGRGWGWGLEDPEKVLKASKGSDRFPALGAEAIEAKHSFLQPREGPAPKFTADPRDELR